MGKHGNADRGDCLASLELDELEAAFPREPLPTLPRERGKRAKKAPAPRWEASAWLTLTATKRGRGLGVMVDTASLVVMAFETSANAPADSDAAQMIGAVFDQHAHQVIGQACSLQHGLELGEQYMARWLAGDTLPAPACECDEIGAGRA